ncbi:MAG: S41 family peptidase [Lentisphaerae bacterium]|jgi:carboxyl-terminal processing protease|nr:S41 family peptidase [Lentisphaerota bacterium]MBT4822548.1 S41 family peptidase [Lentisphaerota bacterium]MBT5604691.1 S41 family peptidase [Lentisphaerota bacterium]MBT7053809.1 S41 family peptidase [Lentisphaerota bacterium]MBT7847188.1 S41 family peptidase [Lentisphaerota bacterium]
MSISPKRQRFWLLMLASVLAINLAVGLRVYSNEAEENGETEAFEKISVMMRVLHLIRKDYVNGEKVDFSNLIYSALRGMVGSLDPFSGFMDPDEYGSMMESTEGQFGGLGIIVTIRDEVLTIVTPIADTPGSRAGLLAGDQIIRIEEESTQGMGMHEAVKRLKGETGTEVNITIHRPDSKETKEVTVERALIPVASVKQAQMLDDKIAYVRLVQFSDPTADRLGEALESFLAEGASSLVLDLRNNPGGLLESAVDVCSYFLPDDKLVVSTQGRQPSQKRDFNTTRKQLFGKRPVAILINRGSASAAEIVAGCLQDWGVAVLVGDKTFGKGSVQNVIELPDGSALRLTTAMYYTPSKRVIHEHGIEPDIEVKLTDEEIRQLIEAQNTYEAQKKPEVTHDRQLQRAIDTLKSYDVYMKARKGKFKELRETTEAESK